MSKAESSVRPVSEEFALLVDAVRDYAIFLLGTTGEIRSWNRGAARIMGYAASEILGSHFSRFYTEQDLRDRKPDRELEVAEAEGRVEDEGWRVRRDGTRFWANTVITALRSPRGELVGFAKVTRDLSEKRAADEKLRHSEELFRLLVTSVRDYAIFMLDANGNIASWNPGAQRIKGYKAEEIIGRHFSTFYPEEDVRAGKPERELELAIANGSMEDEGWRIRKDGTRFWANVVITAVFDAKGTLRGFAKVTRDITDRMQADEMRRSLLEQREARLQAEEEKRRAEASYLALQESNRAKDEFLMTLSHELRTPMTSILGWARLLSTMSPEDSLFSEAVAAIGRSAEHQARLIDDVLDVSRIVAGKLRLSREPVEVEKLVRSSIDAVRPMAESRSIALNLALTPGLGAVLADPTRLYQVIWNLLTNAVKFTPIGGSVTVSADRAGNQLEIAVRDTGEGIDPQFLPHVFEPFRQAENPWTRVHGGLGLGLSIVRYLVEAHGGSVTAASEGKGKGATFTVVLPVESTRAERPADGARSAALLDAQRLAGLRILLVEDDRETREFLRTVLSRAGAAVVAAESGAVALEAFDAAAPDVIVTDVAMPGMDGYELARSIRQRDRVGRVKIIALSAFPAGAATVHESGLDHYLSKPVDPVDLVSIIATTARS